MAEEPPVLEVCTVSTELAEAEPGVIVDGEKL